MAVANGRGYSSVTEVPLSADSSREERVAGRFAMKGSRRD